MEAHRVWAEIDLDALAHNLSVVRRRAGRGVRVMLVVKADAYGHGAVAIAHHAVRCGISAFGVGTSAEAIELRQAGIRLPILVLGTVIEEEAALALRHDVHIGLHASDRRRALQDLANKLGVRAKVHLNVDTGMGRLGVSPDRAVDLLAEIHTSPNLELAGIMTHISALEGAQNPSSEAQIACFEAVLMKARERDLLRGWIHAANSAALFSGLEPAYDTVRPGLCAYGVLPFGLDPGRELRPVLSLMSQVVFLKDLPRGSSVGYGSTWTAGRTSRIATLPVGYDDGLPWRLSNDGEVLVAGRRAPIVGRISMDYTTIDVTDIPDVHVGERVTIIGKQADEQITIEDIAARAGTISYEVPCSISKRVARIHHGGEHVEVASQAPLAAARDSAPDSLGSPDGALASLDGALGGPDPAREDALDSR